MSIKALCRRCEMETKHAELNDDRLRCNTCGLARLRPKPEPATDAVEPVSVVGTAVRDLTTAEKREIADIIRDRDETVRALNSITRAELAIVLYRGSLSAEVDGLPANTRPKAGGRGGKSDPTFSIVTSGLPGNEGARDEHDRDDWSRHGLRDPQAEAISRLRKGLSAAKQGALDARSARNYILSTGEKERGRGVILSTCPLCGGPVSGAPGDTEKDGFGPRCYERWIKVYKPELIKTLNLDDAKARFRHAREIEIREGYLKCGEINTRRSKVRPGDIVPAHVDPDDVEAAMARVQP